MFSPDQYELVDFGHRNGEGWKLERFQDVLVARPSPPAEKARIKLPELWRECTANFEVNQVSRGKDPSSKKGRWKYQSTIPDPWVLDCNEFSMKLKTTPFGHLGVFVEQQGNWDWIGKRIQSAGRALKVLNLFAYTGGSTLAAAAAGAEVIHIDSARNVVKWARENAELSGLDQHPIRWIVEDSSLFVERELKRGNRYDAIIMDPPSFGHGPKGEVWRIEKDLLRLLRNCGALLSDSPEFVLLTCHSPGFGPAELQATLCDSIFGNCSAQVTSQALTIRTKDGRKLNAGHVARWPR